MYAMDQTLHFEHRADRRPTRWELRRSTRPSQLSTTSTHWTAAESDADAGPTHEFVD